MLHSQAEQAVASTTRDAGRAVLLYEFSVFSRDARVCACVWCFSVRSRRLLCHHLPREALLLPDTFVDLAMLKELTAIAAVEDDRYRIPLERDAIAMNEKLGDAGEVILIGSIATSKYVKPLLAVFGTRLLFLSAFAGRRNMSRGGLLLRSVRERTRTQLRLHSGLDREDCGVDNYIVLPSEIASGLE
jgi:hypothetical protein